MLPWMADTDGFGLVGIHYHFAMFLLQGTYLYDYRATTTKSEVLYITRWRIYLHNHITPPSMVTDTC